MTRDDPQLARERCKTLAGFIREFFPLLHPGQPYVHSWNIDFLCAHLVAREGAEIQHEKYSGNRCGRPFFIKGKYSGSGVLQNSETAVAQASARMSAL